MDESQDVKQKKSFEMNELNVYTFFSLLRPPMLMRSDILLMLLHYLITW